MTDQTDGLPAPMTADELGALMSEFREPMRKEWARLGFLQKRIDGQLLKTWMPEGADAEYRDLLTKASTPWLLYGQNAKAQGCVIDGFSHIDTWEKAWQANGMDGRQVTVNREVIGLGKSFGMALPSADGGVVMRPLSAHSTYAHFSDPWDDYPEWALYRSAKRGKGYWESFWYFFDAEYWYKFKGDPATPQELEHFHHGLGYAPVIPIQNTLNTDGHPSSSVEPAIRTFQRIVDYTFTLSMVMRYGAFPQKWMAGGEIATDDNGNALMNSSVDGLLHASGDSGESARFGNFQAANIADVVKGLRSALQDLSSILQIPAPYFLGEMVNVGADGIEAAEAAYFRDLNERHEAMSEGYEMWLRTAASILGFEDVAADVTAEVHWLDQRTRSLAQIVDAISKLGPADVPEDMMFALVPGWTKQDVERATKHAQAAKAQRRADQKALTLADLLPPEVMELLIALGEGGEDSYEVLRDLLQSLGDKAFGASDAEPSAISGVSELEKARTLGVKFDALGKGVRATVEPEDAAEELNLDVRFTGDKPVSVRSQDQPN